MDRLSDMLGGYWEEFRRPSQSPLPPKYRGFLNSIRASMRRAGEAMQNDRDSRCAYKVDADLIKDQEARFIVVINQAVASRQASTPGNVDAAIEALALASSMVKRIAWDKLSWRNRDDAYSVLDYQGKCLKRFTSGWSDKVVDKTVREATRLDPLLLEDLEKWRQEEKLKEQALRLYANDSSNNKTS